MFLSQLLPERNILLCSCFAGENFFLTETICNRHSKRTMSIWQLTLANSYFVF